MILSDYRNRMDADMFATALNVMPQEKPGIFHVYGFTQRHLELKKQ